MITHLWDPPVSFHFRVDFQTPEGLVFRTSFRGVSGLDLSWETEEKRDNDGKVNHITEKLKVGNITLERPLEPLITPLNDWINNSFSYTDKGRVKAYDIAICLQSGLGLPVACWFCSHCIPVKWNLGNLNSEQSGLAIETITLTCSRLERVM